jgi:hypothetical protein
VITSKEKAVAGESAVDVTVRLGSLKNTAELVATSGSAGRPDLEFATTEKWVA